MRYVYIEPEMPELTDVEFWNPLAVQIADEILPHWMDSRRGVEQKWQECDAGYLGYRKLPPLEGFDYIDDSDFGTPTIHNAVNNYCIRLGIGIMDEKEQWLSLVGKKGEDPAVLNAVRQEQAWMHRCAKTRRHFTRGLKQMVIRGINHWFMRWETDISYRKIGTKRGRRALTKIFKANGQDPDLVKQIKNIRQPYVRYNGPVFDVVDAYDVFFDPESDLLRDRKKSYIIRNYMRPYRLMQAKDEDDQDIYSNVGLLKSQKVMDVYMGEKDTTRRSRSTRILGINQENTQSVSADVVPVYTYFAPYLEYEGYEFFDTYFYVARNGDNKPLLIRIEESPSVNGQDMLVSDTFIDWFTDVSYGIGAVQTVLPAWHRKNFFDAVLTNAVAAAQFPAMLYQSGAFKDDDIRLGPAQLMEISQSVMGMDVIRPAINTAPNVAIGFQEQEYLKNDINSTFEVTGGFAQNSTPGSRETATSVNYRASSQTMGVSENREKFGSSLQEMCQWAYDTRQAVAEPEKSADGTEVISYTRIENNKPVADEIVFDDWKRPRTVEILGYHGAFNQQQKIDNKQEFSKALGQFGQFLPNNVQIAQDVTKSLAEDLEIEVSPEAWMQPTEIAASNPEVLKMAIQSLMSNPQMAQQILMEMGMGGPDEQQGGSGGGGNPNAGGGERPPGPV